MTGQTKEKKPLAIIGMGCRFPGGANSPENYWQMLIEGRDGVIDTPPNRWNLGRFFNEDSTLPGKMSIRRGGFLQEPIDGFDPLFFGISPRDAQAMDPQQRLLLELVWEAMEDAGQNMDYLSGSDTGVFIGGFMQDFTATTLHPFNRPILNASSATGVNLAMLANRISHAFHFCGPSIAMDTACSSSLVSFHQGCQSLWSGECSLVVTGGVNLMIRPEYTITLSKGQFLAKDGRCKSFDSRGDGYGRGEGAGIVILKPLHDALRDKDRIYALVQGSAVNQDGHTNGITVPSAEAQQRLIEKVCLESNINPQDISYVEAHGTGTPLGDPTECQALGTVYGSGRSKDNPCIVGSVKANIGHLEAAAGVAGVIKAVLCLYHKKIPPQFNLQTLNPNINFEDLNLKVARTIESLPSKETTPTLVGVNSFGYGGTNAHVILSDILNSTPVSKTTTPENQDFLIPLSAGCDAGLTELAKRWLLFLNQENVFLLSDLAGASSFQRTHLDRRLGLITDSKEDLISQLKTLTSSDSLIQTNTTLTKEQAKRPVFVLTGMGPQWWAMGRSLFQEEPLFRETVTQCDDLFQKVSGWSILTEMLRDESESRITETQFAQPANFVLQVGLIALWKFWGVEPSAIVGHSLGEVSAAYSSGALSLEDAIKVSYHRSRLQQKAVGTGTMMAVALSPDVCSKMLNDYEGVVIAAVNSPTSSNLAGTEGALKSIAEALEKQGVFHKFLRVDIPYHSPAMDPLKEELLQSLTDIQAKTPTCSLYSTVTGQLVQGELLDANYWVRNLRDPVLFSTAMDSLIKKGFRLFLEVGPHPVLATSIQECLTNQGVKGETLFSLYRKKPERKTLLSSLGKLYTFGFPIVWDQLYSKKDQPFIKLPTYPWQRDSYWLETEEALFDRQYQVDHTLLGQQLNHPNPSWQSFINFELTPYLNDHKVEQSVVFPGAGYVEIGLAIHRDLSEDKPCLLEDLKFHQALMVGSGLDTVLHSHYDPKDKIFSIHSSKQDKISQWTKHATGKISDTILDTPPQLDINTLKRLCTEQVDRDQVYAHLEQSGLYYGPWFRGIQKLWKGENQVLVQVGSYQQWTEKEQNYRLHPTLLDACFQALMVILKQDENLYLPVQINRIRFYATPRSPFWGHLKVGRHTSKIIECDITLCDSEGKIYAEIETLRCKSVPKGQSEEDLSLLNGWLYRSSWEKLSLPTARTLPNTEVLKHPIILLMDQSELGFSLAKQLANESSETVIQVQSGSDYQHLKKSLFQVRSFNSSDIQRVLDTVGMFKSVVCLWGLETQETLDPVGLNLLSKCLELIQTLIKHSEKPDTQTQKPPRLYFITEGAQPLSDRDITSLHLAPVVGLSRVTVSEHSSLLCTVLDLDPNHESTSNHAPSEHSLATHSLAIQSLALEILSDNPDTEVAWREGQRWVNRLLREHADSLTEKQFKQTSQNSPNDPLIKHPFRLEVGREGILNSLQLRKCQRRKPGPGELEIEIHAAGVGMRDVLNITQRDPDLTLENSFFGECMGREISGVVTQTGPGVNTPSVGDSILAILPDGFRSHITLPLNTLWIMPRPKRIGDAESGGVPIAFLAANFGLHRAALNAGEKVLIHSAHTGIGLASIQVAQWRGAQLFVTSDTHEKRDYLRSLGIQHVLDARFPTFVDAIMKATDDRGVDVIVNTLEDESSQHSIMALAPFGRFVQMAQHNPHKKESWSLNSMGRNITFMSVDLDHLLKRRETISYLLEDISEQFKTETFKPVRTHVFPADRATEAFQHVQNHGLGKAVIDMRGTAPMQLLPEQKEPNLFRAEGSYLITGGFGSFGLELAHWMGGQGVKQLVLTGRKGNVTPESKQMVAKLESKGIRVMSVSMDVSNPSEVKKLIDNIQKTMPPLMGVIHLAAVLDDALIMDLNPQRVTNVMKPKVLGAWNLHQETKHLKLDYFVLFSSVSSLIGNAGQGNYVAANTYLDTLAHQRRSQGLPAISINWGALGEVGMAIKDKEVEQRLKRGGIHTINTSQAMLAFGRILTWNPPQLGVVHMDWEAFSNTNALSARMPRYSHLITSQKEDLNANKKPKTVHQWELAPVNLRRSKVIDHIRMLTAKVLGIPNMDRVLPHVQLFDLGIDSLTAVELKNNLEADIGLSLGSSLVFNYPTIDTLADYLIATLFNDTISEPKIEEKDDGLQELSDEEAELLLLEELMGDVAQTTSEME